MFYEILNIARKCIVLYLYISKNYTTVGQQGLIYRTNHGDCHNVLLCPPQGSLPFGNYKAFVNVVKDQIWKYNGALTKVDFKSIQ